MPELPEVETIVRELRRRIKGRLFVKASLLRPDMLKGGAIPAKQFSGFFAGKSLTTVERRGKFLLFRLTDQSALVAHLGMTGKFVIASKSDAVPAHLCSQYILDNGLRLDHIDVRRFGSLELCPAGAASPSLRRLGPDPLAAGFNADTLRRLLYERSGKRRRRRAIHPLLLDQNLISGVGNIYASEALYRAGIRPQRTAQAIRLNQLAPLAEALIKVLSESIAAGGTTVNDYRRVDDKPGKFRRRLKVYGRAGQPCRRCGDDIKRITIGGRSAFYCPRCQK